MKKKINFIAIGLFLLATVTINVLQALPAEEDGCNEACPICAQEYEWKCERCTNPAEIRCYCDPTEDPEDYCCVSDQFVCTHITNIPPCYD